jgi:hypothetical protein
MEMISEQRIDASRGKIWEALNNTEILKNSMPGCESFESTGENSFEAKITVKVGPVKAKFKFNVNLTDIDPPNGYTINGEGQGGAAGFAKGSASVNLTEDGSATILAYNVKANVGGKLAQLGARLIDGAARKMADEFFGNFIGIMSGDSSASEPAPSDTAATQQPASVPKWVWITAAVLALAIIFRAFA